jgi:DMSO/TMAO reductase YedYZ molybdopterin-dependent catalytic subunit
MTPIVDRRGFLLSAASTSALLASGCSFEEQKPVLGGLFRAGDLASYSAQRLILSGQSMAREYRRGDISAYFPVVGTTLPEDPEYRRLLASGFREWRLPVTGLVDRPQSFSLEELERLPSRTQITSHSCQEGWTAIGQWTGVQLSRVLMRVGLKPDARFVFFFSADGWWDSLHLLDALHPQTILAYGMKGEPLPIEHGAPLRLRVERQLGYKSLKFLTRIFVTDLLSKVGDGSGSSGVAYGYSWNAGI